jgi:hypothetical protein
LTYVLDHFDEPVCHRDLKWAPSATNPVIVLVDDATSPRRTSLSVGAAGTLAAAGPSAAQRALAGVMHSHGSSLPSPKQSAPGLLGVGGPIESSSRLMDPTKRQSVFGGIPVAYPNLYIWEQDRPSPAARAERTSKTVEMPPWFPPVIDRIKELSSLPPNWDEHGASAIEAEHLAKALVFLAEVMRPKTPTPALVPIGNGGVQVEWHRAGLDVEVPFSKDDQPDLYCYDMESGEEWEGPATIGFSELDLARRLSGGAIYAAQ